MVSLVQAFKPRKTYLIDRDFQVRFAMELMVLVLLVPFVLWANFYVLGQYAMTMEGGVDSVSSWGMTGALLRHQWPLLLLVYFFNFGLVYMFIVYYSHRVAGPVYKFSRTLENVGQGNLGEKISLRKRDYFHDVADRLNGVVGNFRDCVVEARDKINIIAGKADQYQDEELKKTVSELQNLLSKYETESSSSEAGEGMNMSAENSAEDGATLS